MERALVISDMHVGSKWGLTPKGKFNEDTNPFQRWVHRSWVDMVRKAKGSIDYLLLNGDLTDGNGMKSYGVEVNTTSLDDQVNWTIELLEPLISNKTKIFGVDGSGYHSGKSTNTDKRVVENFEGVYFKSTLHPNIGGHLIQMNHASGVTNFKREMKETLEYATREHIKAPEVILRGHIHRYTRMEDATITAISTPSWQYPTPFIEKKKANVKWDIGAIVMEFDKNIMKIYPLLYHTPTEVMNDMRGHMEVESKKKGGTSKKWVELQGNRKW